VKSKHLHITQIIPTIMKISNKNTPKAFFPPLCLSRCGWEIYLLYFTFFCVCVYSNFYIKFPHTTNTPFSCRIIIKGALHLNAIFHAHCGLLCSTPEQWITIARVKRSCAIYKFFSSQKPFYHPNLPPFLFNK
jgi:hypothetical protein